MKVLVTGASGFVGRYLIPSLLAAGHEVWGTHSNGLTKRSGSSGEGDFSWSLIQSQSSNELSRGHEDLGTASPQRGTWSSIQMDIRDQAAVERVVREVQPEAVIHLAAISSVQRSWQEPGSVLETNIIGSLNLFSAFAKLNPGGILLSIGSSEEYGPPRSLPITEDHPTKPVNPYGISKLAQGHLAMQFYRQYGLNAIHLRPFNHIGPGQALGFVASDFAFQIARIEAGLAPAEIVVGNLGAERDFLDVRDVVSAYLLALSRAEPGRVYNLASGRSYQIRQVLDILLALARRPIRVSVDPARLRPVEVPTLVGDASSFRQATGWEPRHTLEGSLRDILNYWRGVVSGEGRESEEGTRGNDPATGL
ncbi:MAG: GDP-mannose 4,6-dehydratase [Firmicutes bacterium]|nr:GDP-mannose 4,6-dehydratase [Bacillota bacterium]MCL5039654.1 GDP-mannose 4,6-dehydratase [Bacillota bacterium]